LVESSLDAKLLPTVLSLIAGNLDAISFLGVGGLFTAMLGVSAVAVPNALVQISLKGRHQRRS
jgi:uncharacterized membrane protein YoaK (UPF0700 family)